MKAEQCFGYVLMVAAAEWEMTMRSGWGLVGLLVALAIVALTVKTRLAGTTQALPVVAPRGASVQGQPQTVRQQSQQVQEQVRQQLETLTQPREMPDDAR